MFCLKARLLDALGSILSTIFFFKVDSIWGCSFHPSSVTPVPGNLIPCPLNSSNTKHTGAHTYTHAHRKPIKFLIYRELTRSTGLMTKISGMVLPSSSSETILLRLSNILSLDLNKSCIKSKTKHLYRMFLVLLFIFPSSAGTQT